MYIIVPLYLLFFLIFYSRSCRLYTLLHFLIFVTVHDMFSTIMSHVYLVTLLDICYTPCGNTFHVYVYSALHMFCFLYTLQTSVLSMHHTVLWLDSISHLHVHCYHVTTRQQHVYKLGTTINMPH